jgi:hypothetical protein
LIDFFFVGSVRVGLMFMDFHDVSIVNSQSVLFFSSTTITLFVGVFPVGERVVSPSRDVSLDVDEFSLLSSHEVRDGQEGSDSSNTEE